MGAIHTADLAVLQALLIRRGEGMTDFFLFVTSFGGVMAVVLVALLATSAFIFFNKRSYAIPFLFCVLATELSVYIVKMLAHRERPGADIAYYLEESFSFPSAHAAIAVALYGFLTYGLMHISRTRAQKIFVISCGVIIISAIGFSRLYLGVHYLSDVIGGFALGTVILAASIMLVRSTRRGTSPAKG